MERGEDKMGMGMGNIYWHLLNLAPGIGPQKFFSLLERFETVEKIWQANARELGEVLGKGSKTLAKFLDFRDKINLKAEIEKLATKQIKLLTWDDEKYPLNLRYIYSPPPVLYYKGDLGLLTKQAVAIVGSRKATVYGRKVAEKLSYDLAQNGIVVVSGMARGIDSMAHLGALKAQGATIAVLGCGLDIVYPRENIKLMTEIISKGLVLTEFPPGTPPNAANFPRRNRIISGLSMGIVVVEAAEKSGSLITADLALEQGKDVFAVPGPVGSPYSKGTNQLIKQGAKLVENAEDILEEFNISSGKSLFGEKPNLSTIEQKIVELLSWEPVEFDDLHANLNLEPEELLSQLTLLELKGLIQQTPGKKYVLAT